ncbi:unnamed protein product [Schistosoma margrebowiei]|uniref:Uncharacterized protein n=1 Tax=Schistosoma margrebowiei TaxID=48269 RepID=A0A183LUP8_9TREM|nr:unnamed protein product [Schistosoma margrebowiei]
MGDDWEGIKEVLTLTCQKMLSRNKHHHKEYFFIETLNNIQERKNKKTAISSNRTRTEKVKAQSKYTEANKQVKRSIRADIQKYLEDLATAGEKAARQGNMKQLYDNEENDREI